MKAIVKKSKAAQRALAIIRKLMSKRLAANTVGISIDELDRRATASMEFLKRKYGQDYTMDKMIKDATREGNQDQEADKMDDGDEDGV